MNSFKTILSSIIVIVTLTLTTSVFACSPAGSDNFFTVTFTPDPSTVPEGISFHNYLNMNGQPWVKGEVYSIENKSPEPFYLIEANPDVNKKFPDAQVPENYIPLSKVTNTTSFTYYDNKWLDNTAPYIQIYGSGWGYFYNENIKVNQAWGETRPANIEIPKSQKIKIMGYFKNKVVTIEGTLSYSLKDKFNPHQAEKGAEACSRMQY